MKKSLVFVLLVLTVSMFAEGFPVKFAGATFGHPIAFTLRQLTAEGVQVRTLPTEITYFYTVGGVEWKVSIFNEEVLINRVLAQGFVSDLQYSYDKIQGFLSTRYGEPTLEEYNFSDWKVGKGIITLMKSTDGILLLLYTADEQKAAETDERKRSAYASQF
jgi:hypothetical protein